MSRGWDNRKSNGDYFTINSRGPKPSLLDEDADFNKFGLDESLVSHLSEMGFTKPTVIQAQAFKPILRGENCLVAAETGSGKTLSYLVPLVQNICHQKTLLHGKQPLNAPLAIIITPGRELCNQIAQVCLSLTKSVPVDTVHVTGGHLKQTMRNMETEQVDILIGSFGAISKLTTTMVYNLTRVRYLVLDEADTLLDDSFNEKLVHFLRKFSLQMTVPENGAEGVQLILASATIPRSAEEILKDAVPYASFRKITTAHLHRLLPHVPQKFLRLSHLDKPAKLLELVKRDTNRRLPVIVFSNKSDRCDWASMFLNENGVSCVSLNGAMSEDLRRNRFTEFIAGKYLVLSCTDVVSRGLDTVNSHQVINYDVPTNMSDYIHRCGRVGRVGSAHASGVITTLVCHPSEADLVQKIEFAARKTASELPNVNANFKRIMANREMQKIQKEIAAAA